MLDTVRTIAPRVRAASPLTESKRRLPEDIFQSLAEIGVFKAFLPRSLGNSSATLSDLGPVIEEIARADGSAGWLAYVGSEALRHTLLLSQPVAARITESPNAFIAGMFTPGESRAKAVTGGYRVAAKVDARTARGEATSSARRDAFLMAAYHAARPSVDVVDTVHRAPGTLGIFNSSHMLRAFWTFTLRWLMVRCNRSTLSPPAAG